MRMDGVAMNRVLQATDVIYNNALQILSSYQVDPKLIPLVMGTVTQRLETFALGAMANELCEQQETESEDE